MHCPGSFGHTSAGHTSAHFTLISLGARQKFGVVDDLNDFCADNLKFVEIFDGWPAMNSTILTTTNPFAQSCGEVVNVAERTIGSFDRRRCSGLGLVSDL